jgi:hypothetical protein
MPPLQSRKYFHLSKRKMSRRLAKGSGSANGFL